MDNCRFFVADYRQPDGRWAWKAYAISWPTKALMQQENGQAIASTLSWALEREEGAVEMVAINEIIGARNIREVNAYASDPRYAADSGFDSVRIFVNQDLLQQAAEEIRRGDYT